MLHVKMRLHVKRKEKKEKNLDFFFFQIGYGTLENWKEKNIIKA